VRPGETTDGACRDTNMLPLEQSELCRRMHRSVMPPFVTLIFGPK
jgi:hypothetical protein